MSVNVPIPSIFDVLVMCAPVVFRQVPAEGRPTVAVRAAGASDLGMSRCRRHLHVRPRELLQVVHQGAL